MKEEIGELSIKNNEANHRFETQINGEIALVEYVRFDNGIIFSHTEVPPSLEGRGIGSKLAQAGLDYARVENLTVVPLCSFVASFIRKHQEYQSLVASDHLARVLES